MKAANFTEFRTKLKQYLDDVEMNNETLIIKRGTGNGAVLISNKAFNENQGEQGRRSQERRKAGAGTNSTQKRQNSNLIPASKRPF